MNHRRVLSYRWTVFLLALGYSLYMFTVTDRSAFGWQFRFLTIWALTANLLASAQMLRLSLGRTRSDWNSFVSMGVVLNVVVVVNYWKLYFENPASVNSSSQGIAWYLEYYLHLMGPGLMVVDAFFILGAFRNVRRVLLYAVFLGVAYPLWSEFVVSPMNGSPVGKVTSGLPYPFLNDMAVSARLTFYGILNATNFVFVAIGWGIARGIAAWQQTEQATIAVD